MASRNTIVAHVEDRPGVLARVASLFRRRGFNIESLTVGHCEEPGLSRMTIVVDGDDHQVDQVCRQLFKLIEVISVQDITYDADGRPRARLDQSLGDQLQPPRGPRCRRGLPRGCR